MVVDAFTPIAEGAPLGAVSPWLVFWVESCAGLMEPSPLELWGFGVSEDSSLWRGDEWIGEADFLL